MGALSKRIEPLFAPSLPSLTRPFLALSRYQSNSLIGNSHQHRKQEAASGIIDLPDDDPAILQFLLQFLYTGNYNDGVTPTFGTPSEISLLRPDEVTDELNAATGVEIPHRRHKVPRQLETGSRRPGQSAENQDSSGDETTSVPNDGSYVPDSEYDSEYSERPPPTVEPEEEYNEFSGENVADEHTESLDDVLHKKLWPPDYNEHMWEKNDDIIDPVKKELSKARKDLFLHLRLYIMADKYDVPALKLLARERFYRSAEQTWEVAEEFPAVVDELYSNTNKTEFAMREIVCRLVGNRVLEGRTRERMDWVMKKHGEFAVGVMNYYILSREWKFTWS